MTESLIAAIERLGHAVEHGADRGAAIRELCQVSGGFFSGPTAGVLLDDWRNVGRRYDAVADATLSELDALTALYRAERARMRTEGGET
ncbi:MAG TPA: hypothetical protein VFU74_21705 [Actinocrinis sp.]|nr:hypothetical protein [Actinocrinis sp.]